MTIEASMILTKILSQPLVDEGGPWLKVSLDTVVKPQDFLQLRQAVSQLFGMGLGYVETCKENVPACDLIIYDHHMFLSD